MSDALTQQCNGMSPGLVMCWLDGVGDIRWLLLFRCPRWKIKNAMFVSGSCYNSLLQAVVIWLVLCCRLCMPYVWWSWLYGMMWPGKPTMGMDSRHQFKLESACCNTLFSSADFRIKCRVHCYVFLQWVREGQSVALAGKWIMRSWLGVSHWWCIQFDLSAG